MKATVRGMGLCLASLLLLGGLLGCQQPAKDTAVLPWDAAQTVGLKTKWQLQVGLVNAWGEKIANMWRVGDTLYVVTTVNQLHSINAANGTFNWHTDLGHEMAVVYRPQEALGGKYVLVMTRTAAYLLERETGKIAKRADLSFAAASDPVVMGNTIAVGGGADLFHFCYVDLLGKDRTTVWSRADSFASTPVVSYGKNVLFASRNGFLWLCDSLTGQALWQNRRVSGSVEGGLATDSRLVYVPSMDSKLFAFEALSGNPAWDVRLDGRMNQAPFPMGNLVAVVGSGKGLFAVTTDKGEQKWFVPGVSQIVAKSVDKLLAADSAGHLLVLHADTGAVEKTAAVQNVARYATNTVDGTAYVITRDGRIAAIEVAR